MAAQELPLHLQVQDTPRATPPQQAASSKGQWFFQGMGFATLMLIGVYSMGGLASPAGLEKPSGHVAAAYSFSPPVNGMKNGGLRSVHTAGLEASAVFDPTSTRAARMEAGSSSPRLPSRSGYPSMSEAEQEGVVTEAAEDGVQEPAPDAASQKAVGPDGDAGDTAESKAAPEEVDRVEEAATEWRRQRAVVEATYDGTFGGGGETYDRQKERMDIIEAALKKEEKKGKQKTVGFAMWAKEVPVGSELPAPIWTKDGQRQGKFWTKVVSRNQ